MLSVVIPFHNEEGNVEKTINEVTKLFKKNKLSGEIIAVNDRSVDKTGEILNKISRKNKLLKIIHRKGNPEPVEFGYAIRDGLTKAKYDTITVMMGDLSDDPNDVVKMLKKINEGYDVVAGSRFIKGGKMVDYPRSKLIANRIWNRIFALLFGVEIKDISNSFKTYRKSVIDSIDITSKGFEVVAEILFKSHMNGFKITEIPVIWYNRKSGVSKFGSFSLKYILTKLPQIGFDYGSIAIKLWFKMLAKKLFG